MSESESDPASVPSPAPPERAHRLRRMSGRDPHEHGRTATALELLYDLVFVVAIGQAADQLAHLVAEGRTAAALGGFAFAMFAAMWSGGSIASASLTKSAKIVTVQVSPAAKSESGLSV